MSINAAPNSNINNSSGNETVPKDQTDVKVNVKAALKEIKAEYEKALEETEGLKGSLEAVGLENIKKLKIIMDIQHIHLITQANRGICTF